MITINQLENIKNCQYKAYINSLNLKIKNNRDIQKSLLLKQIILNKIRNNLHDFINENLTDEYYITKQEKELHIQTMIVLIERYYDYDKTLNYEILTKDLKHVVDDVQLNIDEVRRYEDCIEIIKFKTGKPTLSNKARNTENLPINSLELYLICKLGKMLYTIENLPIKVSYYHMKSKKDDESSLSKLINEKDNLIKKLKNLEVKLSTIPMEYYKNGKEKKSNEYKRVEKEIKSINDSLHFDNSKGDNIVSVMESEFSNLDDVINELKCIKINKDSPKNITKKCDTCENFNLCNYCERKLTELEKVEIKKNNKSSKLKFTDNQQKVIDVKKGNYRINAVAGSGKSTTVVMRVIKLLQNNVKPEDILMITFTNKGCAELKSKIKKMCLNFDIDVSINKLNIFTFNSFCGKLLKENWNKLGFTKEPTLVTNIDTYHIIKEILIENGDIEWLNYKQPLLNFKYYKGAFIQLKYYFNLIKSYNYNIDTLCENCDITLEMSKDIFKLYDVFNAKLLENNLIEYQDQIIYGIKLFNRQEEIDLNGFKYIIVDEYQDTDFMQVELLKQLKMYKNFKSLMVIGDDYQSIYGFRNCTPLNIINFNQEFENVNDINLLENFRSTSQICSLANKLISCNKNQIHKNIISKQGDGKEIEIINFDTLKEENEKVIEIINKLIDDGVNLEDICYLSRNKKQLIEMQKLLKEKGIPNILAASELYLDDLDVKRILNLAKYFKDTNNDYYLLESCVPLLDEVDNIQLIIKDIKEDINITLKLINDSDSKSKEELKIQYFMYLIDGILNRNMIAEDFIKMILNTKEFYTFKQFINYLNDILIYSDNTEIPKDDEVYKAVMLSTAHSSKGKEWKYVILSLNEFKYEDCNDIEEERRLLFVAITRAKDELYITYNTNQDKSRNKGKYCGFVDELLNH